MTSTKTHTNKKMWTAKQSYRLYITKGYDPEILKTYEAADKYIYINDNDPTLQKFRIEMPQPPYWEYIDGFGKHALDQTFEYETYPIGLKTLEAKITDDVHRKPKKDESDFGAEMRIKHTLQETLQNNPREYREEIMWIRRQWWHRIHGKWCMIKGKPVYIDGWNWFYLNYWHLNIDERDGLPEYRTRDRLWFHAVRYAYTTTETVHYDTEAVGDKTIKKLVLLEDGTPRMKDVGNRTIMGINSLKGRRVGDSSKVQCINYCIATDRYGALNGIQGDTGKTAQDDIYNDLFVYALGKMPFFFLPDMPNFLLKKETNFTSAKFRGGLGSRVVPATTAEKTFFDGAKLTFYAGEEVAKVLAGVDIMERHDVVKRCLGAGVFFHGLMVYCSTVENMSGSGKQFEEFSNNSMFEERGADGRTKTGVINIYFPYTWSMEGFIDKWGDPIIKSPTEEQLPYIGVRQEDDQGNIMGAEKYLEYMEQKFIDDEDFEGLASFQRKNPRLFKQCFALASMNRIFNSKILQDKLTELKFNRERNIRVGNFVWENGFGSKVVFVDDEHNGRFRISAQPEESKQSLIVFNGMYKAPAYKDVYVACGDPFRLDKTDSYRMSDGGGAVLHKHDPNIDHDNKPVRDWLTKRFVCTYRHRPPTKDEYCEDMLKMCIFYGALMYPENNIDVIEDRFTHWGYKGYLLYDIDQNTGKLKKNAGFTTTGAYGSMKGKLFGLVADWVNVHAHRCQHPEIIQEILEIPNPDMMKDYDLFVSVAGCLKAEESSYIDHVRRVSNDKLSLDGWW